MELNIQPRSLTLASAKTTLNKNDNSKPQKQYSDPLIEWPARGLAYTNELGAAISEVAPKLGLLLWVPALLYFGADIYDKYKNEKDQYNPNGIRGTEQAVFQLLASVLMPTGSVICGQKLASQLGRFSKRGLSIQSEEETIKFLQGHMSRRNIAEYKDDVDGFKDSFKKALTNYRKKTMSEMKITNPIKTIRNFIFNLRHPEAVAFAPGENLIKFANEKIDEVFSIYNQLTLDDTKAPVEFSNSMFKKYQNIKKVLLEDETYKDTAKSDAIDLIIKKYQKSKIMNGKILKTAGGFIALGLAIKPIDNFVENIIIKRFVKPRLQKFHKNQIDSYKDKTINKS